MIILLGARSDATLARIARAAERQGTSVLAMTSEDLVHNLEVEDQIAGDHARIAWRLRDLQFDGSEVTGVFNRMADLDVGSFGELPAGTAAFAWRELRAYLVFALSTLSRVVNPPEGQLLVAQGESLVRQWQRLRPTVPCPRWWYGRPTEGPDWVRRPGRRVATSQPWDPPSWRPVRLDGSVATGPRLFHEIPPGHPVDVWLLGEQVWVHSPHVRLPDDVTRRVWDVVGRMRLRSQHVLAHGRFFFSDAPALLSFGCLFPTTDLSGLPTGLSEQVESSLIATLAGANHRSTATQAQFRRRLSTPSTPSIFPDDARIKPIGATLVPRWGEPPPTEARVNLIAAETDATACHFARYVRRSGRPLAWWKAEDLLEHGPALLAAVHRAGPEIGFYLRRPGTPDHTLEDCLALVDEALQNHVGPVVGAGADRGTNHSKPLHAATLNRGAGPVRVPDTTVRTVVAGPPSRPTVVKVLSTQKVRVLRHPDPVSAGTQRYLAPVQTQPLITGRNVRVHVLSDKVHALAVSSAVLDYRFDPGFGVTTEELAPDIAAWCVAVVRREHLSFAGVDLIVSGGRTWCLEVNPNPGYHVFEQLLERSGQQSPLSFWLVDHLWNEAG